MLNDYKHIGINPL